MYVCMYVAVICYSWSPYFCMVLILIVD